MLAVSTDIVSGSVHTMISQFELRGPTPLAPQQSAPAAETARIVAVASDDKQNFRTLGMMSSLDGGARSGPCKYYTRRGGLGTGRLTQKFCLGRLSLIKGEACRIS